MAIRTINRSWLVEDVLTSATTVKLSDPTGTYGIKRNDTSATVVADGTALTETSTGQYAYEFTEPVENIAYTAYVEIVYAGATYHFEHDLAAIPVEATTALSQSHLTLKRAIGRYLGYDRNFAEWTTDEALDVADIIQSGLRRFYWPPTMEGVPEIEWTFLRKNATITLVAGDGDYDLPTDFAKMVGDPSVGDAVGGRLRRITEEEIRALVDRQSTEGRPRYYAIRAKDHAATTGSRFELLTHPICSSTENDDVITYQYSFEPGMIDDTNLYPVGGIKHAETVLEACLASAESTLNDTEAVHQKRFLEALVTSIRIDLGGAL